VSFLPDALWITVVDSVTGAPIADPTFADEEAVAVTGAPIDERCGAVVDGGACPSWIIGFPGIQGGGIFFIPSGEQTLTVSAPGYAPTSLSFSLQQDKVACGCTGIRRSRRSSSWNRRARGRPGFEVK
jgi:hypothetical protein